MRKSTILFVLIAVLAVPMLYAADASGSTKTKSHTEVTGTIDQIDLKTMTLTLKVQPKGSGEPEMKIFTFDTKTAFRKKDASNKEASIKAEELKLGDNVKVKADASNLAVDICQEPATPSTYGATQDQPEQKQEENQE